MEFSSKDKGCMVHHKILASEILDGRGIPTSKWPALSKEVEKLFVLGAPCKNCGGCIRDPYNHCVDCHPQCVSEVRRANSKGDVYIAATRTGRIYKIGCGSDAMLREAKLRADVYGGFDDWIVIAWAKVNKMRTVEIAAQKSLRPFAVHRTYSKEGRETPADELFDAPLVTIWQAFNVATKASERSWKHNGMKLFDFSAERLAEKPRP